MPAKVLFISHSPDFGGAERCLHLLLRGLDRSRYLPTLVVPEEGRFSRLARELDLPVEGIRFKWRIAGKSTLPLDLYRRLFDRRAIAQLQRVLEKRNIELAYTSSTTAWAGGLAARRCRIPHVWHIHEILPDNPDISYYGGSEKALQFLMEHSTLMVTPSAATGRQFGPNWRDFVRVVPNSIDFDRVGLQLDQDQRRKARQTLNISEDAFILTELATLTPRKRQDIAVKALAQVRKSIPSAHLVLVGAAHADFKGRILNLIEERGLQQAVTIAGYREDIGTMMALSDVLVAPYKNEAFAVALLEAMASGVPVVAAAEGGTLEAVEHGQTGFLFPTDDPAELARWVKHIANHRDEARATGARARGHVEQKYSNKAYTDGIQEVLAEALKDSQNQPRSSP